MARTCRILDSQGTAVGSLDTSGGTGVVSQSGLARPQASELMVATPGDTGPSFGQPSMAQMAAVAAPQPVPVRDAEGHSLFILRPAVMGKPGKDFNVRVHGPDDTPIGGYQSGGREAKSLVVKSGEAVVATAARDGARGSRQIAVRSPDGTPIVTLHMAGDAASRSTLNVTVTVVGQASSAVRHLAVILPLGFIAQASSALAGMPMPPMMSGSGAALPGIKDISGLIIQGVITSVFESLGGE